MTGGASSGYRACRLVLDHIERGGLPLVNDLLVRHGVGQAYLPAMLRHLELSRHADTTARTPDVLGTVVRLQLMCPLLGEGQLTWQSRAGPLR